MKYSIYVFLGANNTPYYVGRTNNLSRRRKEHLAEIANGNTLPKYQKVRALKKQGVGFRMKTIAQTMYLQDCKDLETFFIKRYRAQGIKLFNLTEGGDDRKKININSGGKIRRGINVRKRNAKSKARGR